ncbi:hypothetical protein [Thermodesulfobacterium hydrogeniphilum]|uniref:hypothetical protein n=1 Tax=Thermodesulfobacterium hydrogeniphilum TaxID=161156 RepID=UPI00056E34CF|nr:hypothetical protein [Thermodesulfobacterium hydrogeniphilum]
MNFKDFVFIFLPLFFLSLFAKIFFTNFFLVYPGNILFSLAIATLTFVDSGLCLYFFLFILGYITGLDNNLEFLTSLYFLSILLIWKKLKTILQLEISKTRLYWWLVNILLFLTFQNLIYFYRLDAPIDWEIIENIIIKNIYYLTITLLWILIFYRILKSLLNKEDEKR